MQSHSYNEIIIKGEQLELTKLYRLFMGKENNIDFMSILGLKGEASFDLLRSEIGTGWFYPKLEFKDGTISIFGYSSLNPPVLLFIKLARKFSSLQIELFFETFHCDTAGHVFIDSKGDEKKFLGSISEFETYYDHNLKLKNR